MKITITIILIAVLLFSIKSYSQEIKIEKDSEGYSWRLTDYTLPAFNNINYRIYDNSGGCIKGGGMDAIDYYSPNYFSSNTEKGKYHIVVYILSGKAPNWNKKILFTKEFEIK